MKIAMVSEHASPLAAMGGADAGGQNVHVADLAGALAARGHTVTVHTRRTDPAQKDTVGMGPGVRVHHVDAGPAEPVAKDQLPPHMPEFARGLADAWAGDRPDVVHAHYWMSGKAVLGIAPSAGIPMVQTFHALQTLKRMREGAADTSPSEREAVEDEVARGADLVIATSSQEKKVLRSRGVPAARIAVVPCGVDLERFSPEGPVAKRGAAPRILSLGRLVPRKGVDTVIAAMPAVPDAELVVAGGPAPQDLDADPEVVRLRRIAERAGVTDRVRFVGAVDRKDVPALFRSADLAVSMPWYEPFGMSTVEAMACGAPVIASAVGGHLDTVVNAVTGRLVPAARTRALAFRLRSLLSDTVTREGYGFAGADRAEACYGWDMVAQRTEQCYEALVEPPRGDRVGPAAASAVEGGR